MSRRECGACQECCYQLEIAPMEKGANERCSAMGARGCTIYEDRPNCCRVFTCAWLQGALPKSQKPNRTGVVVWATQMTARTGEQLDVVQANVRSGKAIPERTMGELRKYSHAYPVVIKRADGTNVLLQNGKRLGEWRDENFVNMTITTNPRTGKREVEWKGERERSEVLATPEDEADWQDVERHALTVYETCPTCGDPIRVVGDRVCAACQEAALSELR